MDALIKQKYGIVELDEDINDYERICVIRLDDGKFLVISVEEAENRKTKAMKRFYTTIVLVVLFSFASFADTFTNTIHDLAVVIACKGTYSATEADGGWYDDPHDYYTPQMMAQRFANESGNKTMTTTFYGVCFNYAQFAFSDIQKYKSWYNKNGMYEGQFWLANVHDNSNQIELMSIGTKNNYTRLQNGEILHKLSIIFEQSAVSAHNEAKNRSE